jgi:hypothetical protein
MLVLVDPFEQVESSFLRAQLWILMGLEPTSIKHSKMFEEPIVRSVIIIFNLLD